MATLRKRGDKWQVQVRRLGHKPTSKSFRLRSDAEAWARQIESEVERGVFIDRSSAERTLLKDVLRRYGEHVAPKKVCYKSDLARIKHLTRHLGGLSLATLGSHHLATYRDTRLAEVSPQSVRHELLLLNRILVAAERDWGIVLPRGIPSTRKPAIPEGRQRRLAPGEQETLLAALKDTPAGQAAVLLALESGMRRGELASMRWEHVSLTDRTLSIPHTKTGRARTIPLSVRAIAVLRSIPRQLRGPVLGMRPDSITQAFERACARANLLNLRFHDLRHEATTRFFEKGLNTMEVATITGHRTLQMLQRYTHLRAIDLLQKIG